MQLYDTNGRRKYLTPAERQDFIRASESSLRQIRTFCETLAHTGCRISEALALTADRVEVDDGVLSSRVLRSVAKGYIGRFPFPLPSSTRSIWYTISKPSGAERTGEEAYIFGRGRDQPPGGMSALSCAPQTSPAPCIAQGPPARLRHQGGRLERSAHMTQKWLGHAQLATTA
jgi:integrase/recombinase XerD